MRRLRAAAGGLTALALGAGLAVAGATSASAEPTGRWGTVTLSGASRDYTGTVTMPGFPETTFRSDSRQATVVSGASTWQSAATPVGAAGYGSSRGQTYLNQRPNADNTNAPATTTYTFAEPTPGAQSWAFVLGDVDADRATISATLPDGTAATAEQLGFGGTYNSCSSVTEGGWSCGRPTADDPTPGSDRPTWDPVTRTLTGNASASDTAGASAWFSPTVPLGSLTITYTQRSGFPVYQTWFAVRTAAISGVATLDGTPVPGATVTVTAPRGVTYTTTTDAEGRYTFPALPQINDYTATITPPDNAEGTATITGLSLNTTATGNDRADADFTFTSPDGTSSVIGTVEDAAGNPAAGIPVVITDPTSGDTLVDTVTNSGGVYTGSGLPAGASVAVSVAGRTPVTVPTGAAGTTAQPASITVPAAAVATITGGVTLDGGPVGAGIVVELLDDEGSVVASTTTGADGRYTFATAAGTYAVRSALPVAGASGTPMNPGVTAVLGATVQSDFAFASPTPPAVQQVALTGVVADTNGDPVGGVEVTATPAGADAGAAVGTTTAADGTYALRGLAPTTTYRITVAGSDETATVTTPETGSATVPTIVVAAAVDPVPTPTSVPTPTTPAADDGPGTTPVSSAGDRPASGSLAYTGADLGPGLVAAGALVLVGAALLLTRALRNRRRDHLQD